LFTEAPLDDRHLSTAFDNVRAFSLLPAGWNGTDIGNPGQPGYAGFDSTSGTWIVSGGGADIFGTADQFHFASESFTGDGTLTAQVTSVQNTDAVAKAGVMFRDSQLNQTMTVNYSDGSSDTFALDLSNWQNP
jgi:hypothetical protein